MSNDNWKERALRSESEAKVLRKALENKIRIEVQSITHCQCKFPLEICDSKGCHCTYCGKPIYHAAPFKEST
jgi:hypothetical protein